MTKQVPISQLPLQGRHLWIELVASMEQIIGAALSAVVGVMIPMINLTRSSAMSSALQGLVGAIGLIGIGIGSAFIGRQADRQGYLKWFRICPALMVAGSLLVWLVPDIPCLLAGLFIIGVGVGGGYSLDSAYISELLPAKWKGMMVGAAKATCSIGFIGIPFLCYWILTCHPSPHLWNAMIWLIGGMGILTLLMRIRWWQSPIWLMDEGKPKQAQEAADRFFGPEAEVCPSKSESPKNVSWGALFKGDNIRKVIFSGIPWACEGLGVYGIGVFLPILVMALGMSNPHLEGIPKLIQSVFTTGVINIFILPGFVTGLLVVKRLNNVKMLYWGFIVCAAGLVLLLCAYLLHWPAWIMLAGFIIFEIFLNAGPHLITYIIPTQVFSIDERGAGNGIAALIGKIGAILGVFFMPVLLKAGGITLVMSVCAGVMLLGALVSIIYGKLLGLLKS